MSPSDRKSRLWLTGSGLKRAIRFATYDWTRELPLSLRVITMIGMGIQGYAIWAALSRSLIWPIMWPSGAILYATILLIYYIGFCIQNATLASELIRKTQLESEPFAAQKIQKTDGLPDSIPGNSPEDSLYRALDPDLARTMSNLKALVDPRFNEDDVTVLLVKRTAATSVAKRD